jgi:uncharacterized protein with HEPN domain
MPRDYRLYLEDIIEAIAKIQQYMEGLSEEMLSSDSKTLDAVVRNLEVIGEAVKMLPVEIRARGRMWAQDCRLTGHPDPWYFGIDLEIIQDIVQNKLPLLRSSAGLEEDQHWPSCC